MKKGKHKKNKNESESDSSDDDDTTDSESESDGKGWKYFLKYVSKIIYKKNWERFFDYFLTNFFLYIHIYTDKPSTSKQNEDKEKDEADEDDNTDNIWKKPLKDDTEKTRLVFLKKVSFKGPCTSIFDRVENYIYYKTFYLI